MPIVIRDMTTAQDAEAFRRLNEQWISQHFVLEAEDRRQLDDPVAAIVRPGGQVLIAETEGAVVGCVALRPAGNRVYELSKMAVDPRSRGRGIGREVLRAALARAAALGASSVHLGSSTKLPNAVHLYETLGFVHVHPEELGLPYARADVFMQLELHG